MQINASAWNPESSSLLQQTCFFSQLLERDIEDTGLEKSKCVPVQHNLENHINFFCFVTPTLVLLQTLNSEAALISIIKKRRKEAALIFTENNTKIALKESVE
ncbi:hypothetical protein AgCh_015953 [Apium graveolens]